MPQFNVRKSVLIDAPLERVYDTVRDFKLWPIWSPWLIAEPDCNVTFSNDGRTYSWDGTIVGAGENGVTQETRPKEIHYRLVFQKPWKSVASVAFAFAEKDAQVEATWSMESSLPLFLFWMKSMMSAFLGMDYERGLLMLKDYVETGNVPSKLDFLGPQASRAIHYVGIRRKCPKSDLPIHMTKDFGRLTEWSGSQNLQPAGRPLTICHHFECVKGMMDYTAAIPVSTAPQNLPSGFVSGVLPEGRVYSIQHTGPYRHLGNMWAAGQMHERAKVFHRNTKIPCFETYENTPDETDENALVTTVHFPIR
jgi:predicted transcriptional regulator YdeE